MTRPRLSLLIALPTAGLLSTLAGAACADNLSVRSDQVTTTGPNRDWMRAGAWTLGLSYVPALVVAIQSDEPADKNLYIPVAGPWMDFAERDCPTCEHETANKVLLVTDGIFQGIGALQLLASFFFVETRTSRAVSLSSSPRPVAKRPALQIAPARLAHGGYGLAARGTF